MVGWMLEELVWSSSGVGIKVCKFALSPFSSAGDRMEGEKEFAL